MLTSTPKRRLKRCKPGCLKHHHRKAFKLVTFEEFKARRMAQQAFVASLDTDATANRDNDITSAKMSNHAVEATTDQLDN